MPSLKVNPDGTPHIHQYVRVTPKPNREIRYRCAHPDCTSLAPRDLLPGKRSLCAVCGQTEIILDFEMLRRAKPTCFKCSGSKKAVAVRTKFAVLDEMFGDLT